MDHFKEVPQKKTDNFVVMDNGNRFYLHVIGLSAESQANAELNAEDTIQ